MLRTDTQSFAAASRCRKITSALRAYVAIQLFAGLRPYEMAELNFENIDLERNQLLIDKEEHTTSHRVVQIMPIFGRGIAVPLQDWESSARWLPETLE